MSNEFQVTSVSGQKLDVILWSSTGLAWNTGAVAFETPTTTHYTLYVIPLTEEPNFPGRYDGSVPTEVPVGSYAFEVISRSTANPLAADYPGRVIADGKFYWSGTFESYFPANFSTVQISSTGTFILDKFSVDGIFIDGSLNLRGTLQLILSAATGASSGSSQTGSSTLVYAAYGASSVARITAMCDQFGNRSNLVYNVQLP